VNELKITGIQQAISDYKARIAEYTKHIETLNAQLEEAQKPQFQPRVFHIKVNTREELMALGAVANRPFQVAEAAMGSHGRIASLTTFELTQRAVNTLLDPIFDAAYKEAYQE
jgi:hypothetical protein